MRFQDASPVDGYRLTGAGYLAADVRIARSGLYQYAGAEVGKPGKPVVTIYRPVDEVFRSKAAASFAHVPVTFGHPTTGVSADSWKRDAVGMVGDEVRRDGEYLRATILVQDATAIAAIKAGTVELSCGYECSLDWTPGLTDSGKPYDAIQRGILANHFAIVDRGRAGSACRIGG